MRIAILAVLLGLASPALARPHRAPPPVAVRVEVPAPVVTVHRVAPVVTYHRVRPVAQPRVIGMHPVRFERLLADVARARHERRRDRILERAARYEVFSSAQVAALVSATPPGRERLSTLRILASRIVDPYNDRVILDVFRDRRLRHEAAMILRPDVRRPYWRSAS